MTRFDKTMLSMLGLCVAIGVMSALARVRAEPEPALDRALVERLIRAQESQARALEQLVKVADRCKH